MALKSLAEEQGLDFGFEMTISKGIPLGSGLGGSAASAVAAGLAENLGAGVVKAAESIDSGSAWAKLQQLKERCPA